jgi:hypothetical protein
MKIPEALIPSLQGAIPAHIITVDEKGVPNITIISQVYYVDDEHMAISNQFFSKTFQNLKLTKKACVQVIDPSEIMTWIVNLELEGEMTEGALFDEMAMQLEAIASMTGMQDVFKLRSAYIFRVLSYKRLDESKVPR